MLNGRADATINDSLSFLDFKKHKPDANVKIAAEQENADYSGVIVRKGDPELVAAINKALADDQGRRHLPEDRRQIFRPGRLAVRHLSGRSRLMAASVFALRQGRLPAARSKP